jgi:hypothetical protein
MSADEKGKKLATGKSSAIIIWEWSVKENCECITICFHVIYSPPLGWVEAQRLAHPDYLEGNERQEVNITAMHWLPSCEYPCSLVVAYRNHGVQ